MRTSDARTTRAASPAGTEPAPWWAWPLRLGRRLLGWNAGGDEPETARQPRDRFRTVCLSRETGAGGSTVGRLLGTRLGWKVYDHELIEAIAHGMEIAVEDARTYDEQAPGLIQDWLLPLREEHYAPQEAYLDHLAKLVQTIGRAGRSIIVGRGAAWLLPRSETLSVRLVAPLSVRARRVAERMGLSYRTARRVARDLDHRHERFIRTLHRSDPSDPHAYDLVLDTDSLGLTIAVEVIARAVEAGWSGNRDVNGPAGSPPTEAAWPSTKEQPETGGDLV